MFNKINSLSYLMKTGDVEFLNQLAASLEEAQERLESSYKSGNVEEFNKSKKIVLEIQRRILRVLK